MSKMSKVFANLILSNTPQMNYKRQQDLLILVFVCLGWCLQHLLGCFTNPLLSPANFRFSQVYPIGDKLVFAGEPLTDFYVYDPATGDWAPKYLSDLETSVVYAVIGHQLVYPAWKRHTAIDIIDFSADILQRRTINHTSEIPFGVALAVANTVIFGQPDHSHLVFVDVAANTSRDVQLSYSWNAATSHEDTAYFFHSKQTQVYSVHNDSWTVIPLDREIQDAYVRHSFIFNGYAILITERNIVKLDILTGHWETLIRTAFPAIHKAILHNGKLFLIVGPSMSIGNTIFTYDLITGHRFSWPYNQYNLVASSIAAFDDKLYFVYWNSASAWSTAVLVYDINDTQYTLVPAFDTSKPIVNFYLYSAQHGEYIVIPTFAETNSQVFMYNLNEGTWKSWPWPNARYFGDIVSSENFLVISGGLHPSPRDLSIIYSVDIYNVETNSWSETTVPREGMLSVVLVDDTLFFSDEFLTVGETHFVYIYNISRDQWTTQELTNNQGMNTVFNTHDHLLFISDQASAIDIYNIANQSWKTALLTHKRFRYGIIEAEPYLFIAGGMINKTITASIEVFNLHTLEFGPSLNLSEPRINVVPAFANPYVAFIGGMRPNGAFSSTIDIYNIQTGYWSRVPLPQPELLGLDFGVTVIGQAIYLRNNNYLYILYPDLERVEPLLTPFMSGNKIVSLGKHLIGFGESALEGVFYFLDTTTGASWQMTAPDFSIRVSPLIVWNNKVIIYTYGLTFIELPVIANNLEDKHLFRNQEITLEIDAVGHRLSYMWLLNQQEIEGEYNSSLVLHGDTSVSGTYTAIVQDHCGRMTAQAVRVTLQDKPVFYTPLEDQMVLCSNESIPVSVHPTGAVTLQWTLDGNPLQSVGHEDDSERITIPAKSLTCNSIHCLCAHASNPSGPAKTCSEIHVVHVDSVFSGPVETAVNAFISVGSTVTLKVDILDTRCTSHIWYEDSTPRKNSTERYSTIDVEVTDDIEKSRFYVIATCVQGSTLRSNPKQIKQSFLPLWALVVVIIVASTIVIGAIVGIVKFRFRLNRSRQHEIELKSLLNEAKQETMAQSSTEIIHTTTWEWSPDESYSFSPLEKLPLNFDTSNLGFSKKNDPVDVNYWIHGTIVVSSKEKRRSISSFLQQSLIRGHHVEIYAPKSPKFEVKVDPTSVEIEDDGTIATLTVSVLMKMTTKAKIRLVIVLEKQKIYSSIDFTLVSKPSPWIDVDDIEMSNQILGQGGFGTVTRGTYKGQDVAVKMLNNQHIFDYVKTEFEREIAVMKSLHHPNIIQFVGASNVAGKLGLVTEFAPLGSLASALENHLIAYNLKLVILLEIARAIQFLHSNNIIHRDIKPLNVLVFSLEHKASVHVKLTDFGTSKFVSESTATMTRNTGTTKYMAPETLGKKPRFDTSADLYSFAVLMWEVITNESAFSTAEFEWQTQIENFVTAGNRLPLPKELDTRLAKLISDCWAQEPTERPPIASVVQQLSTLVYEHN